MPSLRSQQFYRCSAGVHTAVAHCSSSSRLLSIQAVAPTPGIDQPPTLKPSFVVVSKYFVSLGAHTLLFTFQETPTDPTFALLQDTAVGHVYGMYHTGTAVCYIPGNTSRTTTDVLGIVLSPSTTTKTAVSRHLSLPNILSLCGWLLIDVFVGNPNDKKYMEGPSVSARNPVQRSLLSRSLCCSTAAVAPVCNTACKPVFGGKTAVWAQSGQYFRSCLLSRGYFVISRVCKICLINRREGKVRLHALSR